MPKKPDIAPADHDMDEYQMDDHARTLQKAQEIKSDPKLKVKILAHMKKKHAAMKGAISDLDSNDPGVNVGSDDAPAKSFSDLRKKANKISLSR